MEDKSQQSEKRSDTEMEGAGHQDEEKKGEELPEEKEI